VLLVLAVVFIGSAIDSLKVMAFVGSLSAAPSAWTDPVFGEDLGFYMVRLPFYTQLLRFVFVLAVFTILVFWASGRGWQLFERLKKFRAGGGNVEEFDPGPNPLLLTGLRSDRKERIYELLETYAQKVHEDFHASAPAPDKPTH
jgi:hypothetical protein